MNTFELNQGDTSPIIYTRPSSLEAGELIDGDWICKTNVVDSDGVELIAERTVTEKATISIKNDDGSVSDEECFVVYLTPTETESLAVTSDGLEYIWTYEISNSTTTPLYNIETQQKLTVNSQNVSV